MHRPHNSNAVPPPHTTERAQERQLWTAQVSARFNLTESDRFPLTAHRPNVSPAQTAATRTNQSLSPMIITWAVLHTVAPTQEGKFHRLHPCLMEGPPQLLQLRREPIASGGCTWRTHLCVPCPPVAEVDASRQLLLLCCQTFFYLIDHKPSHRQQRAPSCAVIQRGRSLRLLGVTRSDTRCWGCEAASL